MTLRRLLPQLALLLGACTGPTYDESTTVQFSADPPEVYVAKVKNILVGLPPTDDEIAQVMGDPTVLPDLIDGWMQMPEYQDKMMVFFELAFQQTQISTVNFIDIAPPRGLGTGKDVPLVVQNARESFARTVLEMTKNGQSLTDAFTTRKFMMTPALMQVYAYLDAMPTADDSTVKDLVAQGPLKGVTITLEESKGPIPIAQSLNPSSPNYMTFYTPELTEIQFTDDDTVCQNVDPITFPAGGFQLFDVMYGVVPPHKVGTHGCPIRGGGDDGNQLVASDFTTWKMVTVRAPNAGEAQSAFYDLPSLRNATELVVNTPRVGYFSTPAFEANWPTNASNTARVTVNQALIVATGMQIDGTDGTQPGSTPGLDADHAQPGTACYGCHQLLDPTRSILTSTYTYFYSPQQDQKLIDQPGLFAFQHVVKQMSTIDDFAKILAQHPLVPGAWVEKLCYYVNSSACDPNDPVTVQLVTDFSNGMNWNNLVKGLLSSPIVTNASHTKTFDTNGGEVIAVSRRDHLCAAINDRLGFNDICMLDASTPGAKTTISQIVSGMPSDGYGRGGVLPVLPNEPTLFYRAGLENICGSLSQQTIDAKPNANQPNAKQWTSADPTTAIHDFVSIMMGLTSSDARSQPVTDALTQHFADAQAQGATKTDALRSTFVAACLSPSFIGIGM
ncbi:MAG: hypothetical protein QM831_19265 [Kofleriaceae bacterium]